MYSEKARNGANMAANTRRRAVQGRVRLRRPGTAAPRRRRVHERLPRPPGPPSSGPRGAPASPRATLSNCRDGLLEQAVAGRVDRGHPAQPAPSSRALRHADARPAAPAPPRRGRARSRTARPAPRLAGLARAPPNVDRHVEPIAQGTGQARLVACDRRRASTGRGAADRPGSRRDTDSSRRRASRRRETRPSARRARSCTTPSSSGWRSVSSTRRLNSGSSSRNSTPRMRQAEFARPRQTAAADERDV